MKKNGKAFNVSWVSKKPVSSAGAVVDLRFSAHYAFWLLSLRHFTATRLDSSPMAWCKRDRAAPAYSTADPICTPPTYTGSPARFVRRPILRRRVEAAKRKLEAAACSWFPMCWWRRRECGGVVVDFQRRRPLECSCCKFPDNFLGDF